MQISVNAIVVPLVMRWTSLGLPAWEKRSRTIPCFFCLMGERYF